MRNTIDYISVTRGTDTWSLIVALKCSNVHYHHVAFIIVSIYILQQIN